MSDLENPKGLVLDSSALFYGKDFPEDYDLIISPGVVRELTKHGMGQRLELLLATRLKVLSPSKRSLTRVIGESERTGDARRLSSTDKEILALAMELDYDLVTDDYSLQNLASALGIPFRALDQKGISEIVKWETKCVGCGKRLPPGTEECDICGSGTKDVRRRE